MVFIVLLVTLIVIAIVHYRFKHRKFYNAMSKFPGSPGLPLIGNAHLFIGDNEHLLKTIMDLSSKYPSASKLSFGPKIYLAVYEPEHMKAVLNSPSTMEKNELYDFVKPWAETGLILASVPVWRKHRRIISPTFNQRVLNTYVPVFDQQAKILVNQLRDKVGKGEFEIHKYMAACTLDMVFETSLGVKMNVQVDSSCPLSHYADEGARLLIERMQHIWLHPDFIYYRTKDGKALKKYVAYMHHITDEVIRKKKLQYQEIKNVEPIDPEKVTVRKNFLELLLELEGEKLTDQEIRDEVVVMINVGFDTTASTSTFVLLMLALHPEIQEKVYEEIMSVYSQKSSMDECLTNEDLQKLKYLERVIKETLRLFTITPLFARQATEDFELDGKLVPKGTSILLLYMRLHRNEKFWQDPLKFDPDRFLLEEVVKRNPYSFIPFAAGPRNCIGLVYAMMSMKTLLTNVLKEYRVAKDNFVRIEDIRLKFDIVLRTVDPIKIKLEKRTR